MRKHSLDLFSLVAGLLFVAVGAIFLAANVAAVNVDARYAAPVALMIVGAIGLALALRKRAGDEDSPS